MMKNHWIGFDLGRLSVPHVPQFSFCVVLKKQIGTEVEQPIEFMARGLTIWGNQVPRPSCTSDKAIMEFNILAYLGISCHILSYLVISCPFP
jgi:hypothetical protein